MKKYVVTAEDNFDCGAASLASIIKYYDGYVPLEMIKYDTLTKNNGTSFYYLKEAAIKYGFVAIGSKSNDLEKVKLPCIVQLKIKGFHHFVCVYEYREKITIMDPSKGLIKMSRNDFSLVFNNHVLELIPNGRVLKLEQNKQLKILVKDTFKAHLKRVIIILILVIPIIILTLISSFNIILLFQYNLILLVFLMVSLNISLTYLKNLIQSSLNYRISFNLIKEYLKHILNLPLNYLQLKKVGDLTNRIHDLYNIKEIFSKTLIDSLTSFILLIGSLLILFHLDPTLSIIICLVSFSYLIISYFLNRMIYYQIISIMDSDNTFVDLTIEYLTKIKTLKNLHLLYFNNKLDRTLDDALMNKYLLEKKMNLVNTLQSILEEGCFLIIIIYVLKSPIGYLELILYITVYHYYLNNLKYFINLIPSIMYFKNVLIRINGLFAIEKEKALKVLPLTKKDIIIKDLSYSHDNISLIFNHFNLTIKKGHKVWLRGENGSGKSTLLDIISSNIPTNYIETDGKISYIHQKAELFSGSILENIIVDNKYEEFKFRVIEKIVYLNSFSEIKANGYMTHIYGANLSGGEIQRIILARGLYRDFDILIIDEALSQIAKKMRKQILDNIWKYFNDKTIIYVSHNDDQIIYDKEIFLTARKDEYVNERRND